nr:hypothetical protein [Tanacetum cinerariifolium]
MKIKRKTVKKTEKKSLKIYLYITYFTLLLLALFISQGAGFVWDSNVGRVRMVREVENGEIRRFSGVAGNTVHNTVFQTVKDREGDFILNSFIREVYRNPKDLSRHSNLNYRYAQIISKFRYKMDGLSQPGPSKEALKRSHYQNSSTSWIGEPGGQGTSEHGGQGTLGPGGLSACWPSGASTHESGGLCICKPGRPSTRELGGPGTHRPGGLSSNDL